MKNITTAPLALPPPRLTLFDYVLDLLPCASKAYYDTSTVMPHADFEAAMAAIKAAEDYADSVPVLEYYDFESDAKSIGRFGPDRRKWIQQPHDQIDAAYRTLARRAVEYMAALAAKRKHAAERAAMTRRWRAAERTQPPAAPRHHAFA